jgi:hypothetical protein
MCQILHFSNFVIWSALNRSHLFTLGQKNETITIQCNKKDKNNEPSIYDN